MLLAQSGWSADPNPIRPGAGETLWSFVTVGVAILAIVLLVLVVRWGSFHIGFQLGRLSHRSPKGG